MVTGPTSDRNAPNLTGGADRYETLLEVLEQQSAQARADREREARERERRRRRRVPSWLLVALLVGTAWVWLFPPSFLRVEAPTPQPVAEEEAALRFAIYVQAQRIELYRREAGRLPETLEEAGPPLEGMSYLRLSRDLYQLTGSTARVTLTYRSDLPLDAFVGSGADVVDEERIP